MPAPDATIQALRKDMALQITRFIRARGLNQVGAAKQFRVPQPTISKIVRGRVADLSLELLIRIAVRAGLPLALQTGQDPSEAGVFVSSAHLRTESRPGSALARAARTSLVERTQRLRPEQRLSAFLEHTQLVSALHRAGRAREARARVRHTR
jgi:predicted XRE-type DNA-binding protein